MEFLNWFSSQSGTFEFGFVVAVFMIIGVTFNGVAQIIKASKRKNKLKQN